MDKNNESRMSWNGNTVRILRALPILISLIALLFTSIRTYSKVEFISNLNEVQISKLEKKVSSLENRVSETEKCFIRYQSCVDQIKDILTEIKTNSKDTNNLVNSLQRQIDKMQTKLE